MVRHHLPKNWEVQAAYLVAERKEQPKQMQK